MMTEADITLSKAILDVADVKNWLKRTESSPSRRMLMAEMDNGLWEREITSLEDAIKVARPLLEEEYYLQEQYKRESEFYYNATISGRACF